MVFLFKKKSIKYLIFGKRKITGRNNSGKLVLYRRGGGHKKNFKIIDFNHYIWNIYGIILRFEYDSLRNIFISLIIYGNGIFTYHLTIKKMRVGMLILTKDTKFLNIGYTTLVKNIKSGMLINSIELELNQGSKYIRSAGIFSKALTPIKTSCLIKLKSKEIILINKNCLVTFGILISNNIFQKKFKKASFFRYKGWRPIVRGVAMNPIDHPHGGGQGKTSGGRPSVDPWGIYTKGIKTRKKLISGKIYLKR